MTKPDILIDKLDSFEANNRPSQHEKTDLWFANKTAQVGYKLLSC